MDRFREDLATLRPLFPSSAHQVSKALDPFEQSVQSMIIRLEMLIHEIRDGVITTRREVDALLGDFSPLIQQLPTSAARTTIADTVELLIFDIYRSLGYRTHITASLPLSETTEKIVDVIHGILAKIHQGPIDKDVSTLRNMITKSGYSLEHFSLTEETLKQWIRQSRIFQARRIHQHIQRLHEKGNGRTDRQLRELFSLIDNYRIELEELAA